MLGDALRHAAARAPDAVAFVEADRRLTYGEWDWLSDRAAFALSSEGLREGDVVALLLQNSIAYPIAYLGAAKIGCVTVGINPRLAQREIDRILDDSLARALVTDRPFTPQPRTFSPADLNRPGGEPPRVRLDPDAPVALVYTSGTTGEPKGALYTASCLEAVRRIESAIAGEREPRTLQSIPMAHMQFMTKIGSFIDKQQSAVVLERWTARDALDAIERDGVTGFGGIPAQLALMLREETFEGRDLSSLRSVTLGGAPASPALIGEIRARFGVPVIVRYSCTELALCAATRVDDPDEVVAHTVGRPLPEVDVRIANPGPDGVGGVCARSPAMMRGYWRRDDAGLDADGYFHTGDLGYQRPDGNLVLVGRAKEMYIRGGYNVYPVEVEGALREHPGVADAAVVAYADDVLGEKGAAFVVPADASAPPDPAALREHLSSRIADYKRPDQIEVRDALPLTEMFKIDKRALRMELEQQESSERRRTLEQ